MLAKLRWVSAPLIASFALVLAAAPAGAASPVTVTIKSPASGATVFGTIAVAGTAASKYGISSVSVAVDSGSFQAATFTSGSWTYGLDTNSLSNAGHKITARAVDTHRNAATTSVTVTVNNTPPVISISSPQSGALVIGTFAVSGTASSQAGVAGVQVRVDQGAWSQSPNTTSWAVSINSAAYADGGHTITAMASDTVGHSSTASITVTFSNSPPAVSISAPQAGALLSGAFTVSGTASSLVGVASVQIRVDSAASVSSANTNNWAVSIDSTAYADGAHAVYATATDSDGRSSTTSVPVTFSNSSPAVSISSPSPGAVVFGTLTVSGAASSSAGIASVSVQVDSGAAVTATGTNSWSEAVDTTTLTDGAHTITAVATDSLGRSSSASVSVTADNTAPAVSIQSPQAGATISSTYVVSGYASSKVGIASVQVQVDANAPVIASGTQSWSTTIDTTTLTAGAHTITAIATDSLGRTSSTSVAVTVSRLIQTHQAPWFLQDSTGNVSTVNETMMWDGDSNQSSPLPTGTITFQVNSAIQPNDANTADTCTQDANTGYWTCVHTLTSADLQWAPFAGGWSVHYAFNLQVEYPPASTFTISYSGDANFAPSSAVAANT